MCSLCFTSDFKWPIDCVEIKHFTEVSSLAEVSYYVFAFLWLIYIFLITRRSKIVSRATGRYAATSFDQLLVCPRSSLAIVGVALFFFCPPRLFPVFDRLASMDRPRLFALKKKLWRRYLHIIWTHCQFSLLTGKLYWSTGPPSSRLLLHFFCWLFFFSDRQTQNQGTHSTANKKGKWLKR